MDCAGARGLRFPALPVKPEPETVFLMRNPLMAILPEDHPLHDLEPLPVEALCQEPFPLPEKDGKLCLASLDAMQEKLNGCDALALGPGLGRGGETEKLVRALLWQVRQPLILDADGLNALQGCTERLCDRRGRVTILTPHDGEYRRLMGRLPGEDRMGAAAALAEKTGATVLLKGHRTAICGADERWENRCGNPGLATGGSGDVLAGILVSLLGQGLPPVHAAAAAAWLHGTAADRCAARMGEYGLLPSDVAAELPYLLP